MEHGERVTRPEREMGGGHRARVKVRPPGEGGRPTLWDEHGAGSWEGNLRVWRGGTGGTAAPELIGARGWTE